MALQQRGRLAKARAGARSRCLVGYLGDTRVTPLVYMGHNPDGVEMILMRYGGDTRAGMGIYLSREPVEARFGVGCESRRVV